MYRILNLLLLSLVLFSCKKEDKKPDIKADITFSKITAKTATVNVHVTGASGLTYTLQYKDSAAANANWANVTLVNDTATVFGLTPGKIYTFAAKVYSGETLVSSSEANMTTSNFTLDAKWFYSFHYTDYCSFTDKVFSIEGATVTIKGKDFYDGMTATFIQQNNTANVIQMPVTLVNDSTITFKVPEIIPDNPYVSSMFFALKINNVLFPSYGKVMVGNHGDSTFFKVNNGVFNIDSVKIKKSENCDKISLHGKFYDSPLLIGNVTNFVQVPLVPVSKTLVIRKGESQVENLTIPTRGDFYGCGALSDVLDDNVRSYPDGLHNYPHITTLWLNMTFSPGNYTAQVIADMGNNIIRTSNEFPFTVE